MPSDKLTIDTPEQVHLEFVLADIGSRFMAVFADTVIQILAYLVLVIVDETAMSGAMFSRLSGYQLWIKAAVIFLNFCIFWGYYAAFEALWNGQTPGKRWAGIRVIKETGRPINAFEALARNFLRIIDLLPLVPPYAVGIITMLLNPKNRRLGDFVAGTLVVHDRKAQESDLFFNTPQKTPEIALYQAGRLGVPEVELIETFLARRLDIPPDVRKQSATRIADMICSKLGIDPGSRPADNENFLELIVREFRSRAQYR
ncbi:MAG TPA: RDD family protein [Candidatus Angelobacter sp.]|nr:RDD family protein [Candidatus Angelobacter sp.]